MILCHTKSHHIQYLHESIRVGLFHSTYIKRKKKLANLKRGHLIFVCQIPSSTEEHAKFLLIFTCTVQLKDDIYLEVATSKNIIWDTFRAAGSTSPNVKTQRKYTKTDLTACAMARKARERDFESIDCVSEQGYSETVCNWLMPKAGNVFQLLISING